MSVPGVNPSKLRETCECGGRMRPTRQVGPYASVPVECDDCDRTGTIAKNRYGYVIGTRGAVVLEAVADGVEVPR